MSNMIKNNTALRNGLELPLIGFGMWKINDKTTVKDVLDKAFKNGYSLLDTAAAYSNEIAIAKAIKELGINRNSVIISDKVWNNSRGYNEVRNAFSNSCKKLKTDWLDVYLIHWPASKNIHPDWKELNAETWKGMESLYRDGSARAIGVCNFNIEQLEELKKTAEIFPMINQIEFHPGLYDKQLYDYCKTNGIQLMASSPLGNGQILNNETLKGIADKRNKTIAQICLRWIIQKGAIAIPKTTNESRLSENLNIFDFELDDEENDMIDQMDFCGGLNIKYEEELELGY